MLQFKRIETSLSQLFVNYSSLIIPYAIPLLKPFEEKDICPLVVGAFVNDNIIGLIIGKSYKSNRTVQMFSFVMHNSYRQRGIGHALFHFFQQEAILQKKNRAIGFEYDSLSEYATPLEKILQRSHWQPSYLYLIRCYYDNVAKFDPKWIYTPYKLSSDFEIFQWADITLSEKKLISFQQEQGVFLSYLSPFDDDSKIESLNSLGLKYKGKIIGWNITHRINCDTIKYSSLYIEKEFQHLGYGIILLVKSMHLHKLSSIKKALFEINLEQINPPWERFVYRRLIPHADRIEKMKWAYRAFIHPSSLTSLN